MPSHASDAVKRYYSGLICLLEQAQTKQTETICRAGVAIAETIAKGGMIYTFGTGHSRFQAEEAYARAGGLAGITTIVEPRLFMGEPKECTELERQEGLAKEILARYDLRPGDVLIVASNSGRNAVPIEMAAEARARGLLVIALTSMDHSRTLASRHHSGKRLYEVADIVLDSLSPLGDAMLTLTGLDKKIGPTSTVVGASLVNAMMIAAAQEMLDHGIEPPVLLSSNLDDADDYNWALLARYERRASSASSEPTAPASTTP